MADPVVEGWAGTDVTIAEIEGELARLRDVSATEGRLPHQRTSVMTHVAWVPSGWLDAAERTLEGMAERHPSRTVILVPRPEEESGLDAEVSVRSFPFGDRAVCGEVIELHLRGDRVLAPASLVLPLVISDLPVFLRWRGDPPFGEPPWEQLIDVADRAIVDSSEWEAVRFDELAECFPRAAVSDISWARLESWRIELADRWPEIRDQEIAIRGPWVEAALLRGWLVSRLRRPVAHVEPAPELGVRLGGEELTPPGDPPPSASDLLSDELDRFTRDRVYEEAVAASLS